MDVEKQREIIRLWNEMRRVEGPVAEEIRIQISGMLCAMGVTGRERAAGGPWARTGSYRSGASPERRG